MSASPVSSSFFRWLAFAVILGSIGVFSIRYNKLPSEVLESIKKSPTVIFLSLEPKPENLSEDDPAHRVTLKDYPILGSFQLNNEQKHLVADTLSTQVPIFALEASKCFDPRHAIRIEKGSETMDLLICYDCGWIEIHHSRSRTVRRHMIKMCRVFLTNFYSHKAFA
ncbi:hypothetical protein [Prosthecobacter dejongeii]|uniref:Uncharacterized protein n=1 Tax=Prosthecobacter dejongeii TaxID=48465 RepID=A0A7W8DP52_9BACT|nr:hypothetical protein [Prosthecobacter dejongeii]MBB5036962.1 hypothetical protein [Prosthecobacter dejongeii]